MASQTAGNITVVDEAATLPFLRPLIGMDKTEITEQAQKIGTHETSIEPDQDCCSLFVPPHPSTQAKLEDVRRAESMLDIHFFPKFITGDGKLDSFRRLLKNLPPPTTPNSLFFQIIGGFLRVFHSENFLALYPFVP